MAIGAPMLSEESRITLLRLARESIAEYTGGPLSAVAKRLAEEDVMDELLARNGVFVTLHRRESDGGVPVLRGCIGNIIGLFPLYQSVRRLAVESAAADPRFRPVRDMEELEALEIEISVLSIPAEIESYQDIRFGRDGVILRYRGRSALFLPQVAVEQGWGPEETLSHLAMKAGLNPEAWKDPECSFETFQAEVFSENSYNMEGKFKM